MRPVRIGERPVPSATPPSRTPAPPATRQVVRGGEGVARRPVPVKHPHVDSLKWCVCHPTPTAPASPYMREGRFRCSVRQENGARKRIRGRGSTHDPRNAPAGRRHVVRGSPAVPEAGSARASNGTASRRWARRRVPSIPSARLTHGQAAPPGDTVRKESRDTPPVAGGVPAPTKSKRTPRCASRAASRLDPVGSGSINFTCSAPGGGACHWHSASADDGTARPHGQPTAADAVSTVAPLLPAPTASGGRCRSGVRTPSDTGRGALRRDAPNVSPVSRLPWGRTLYPGKPLVNPQFRA